MVIVLGAGLLQRVAPTDTGKSVEIGIIGMDFCAILYRQCCDMRVRYKIRSASGDGEIAAEVLQVTSARIERHDVIALEPGYHIIDSLYGRECDAHCPWVGHQSHEPGRYTPRQPDLFFSTEQSIPPLSGDVVVYRSIVVSVNQQIDVRDDHQSLLLR